MTRTYSDYANKTRSSKLLICHVEPLQRVSVFSNVSGTIYKKSVNHVVIDVIEDGVSLAEASSTSVATGEWFYDHLTSELYLNTSDDLDPKAHVVVLKYRLFYSNRPIDLPHDLSSGFEVNYDGRLQSNSPIKKELDDEQIGVMLETATNLSFFNGDAYFDDIYDVLIFENQSVRLYSWNETIPLSEIKKLFDGYIQNKSFTPNDVKFSCKDFAYKLREPVAYTNFSSSDGDIPEKYLNTPKRRLFGQFKQLQCVPIDAILDGYDLTGSITGSFESTSITGYGTSFLSELSPEDELLIITEFETLRFSVDSISSDTSLTLSSALDRSISNLSTVKVKSNRPYRGKNRNWHIAGHKLRAPSTTITSVLEANRFSVASTNDLFAGDLVNVSGEDAFIKRISGSQVTLSANLQAGEPSIGDTLTKNPLSKAFVDGFEIFINRDWSITNTTTDAKLILDPLTEFNIAPAINIPNSFTFTSSSREVSVTGLDLRNEIQPRDWIRSDDITHATWYEILSVSENTLLLRVAYAGSTITTNAQKKNVALIDENSIVTVNCIGQERSSAWIRTAADAVKDMIQNDALLSNINTASFTQSNDDMPFIISYALPERIGGKMKTIREAISDINKSVFGSLVTDSDFNLRYQVLSPEKPSDMSVLKDDDIIGDISIKSKNEIVRKVNAKYGFFSDKFSGDSAFSLYEFENDFVDDLIGSKAELDVDLYLFNQADATIIAQRYAFYNSLSQSTITIKTNLSMALKALNDKLWMQFDRMYKRLGNQDRKKLGIINSISNDGSSVSIVLSDLSNAFNRAANISDDLANDFTSASENEKIIYSYIVDSDTLTADVTSDKEIYQNLIA